MFKSTKERFSTYLVLHKWPYWFSSFVVGIVAVAYAKIIIWAEKSAFQFFNIDNQFMIILSPILFFISWFLVYRFAPEAKGSGIPQVMASIELINNPNQQHKIPYLLSLKIVLIKIISSFICLLGGGAIGREGPTLQVSASIFYFFSQRFKSLKKYVHDQTWLIAGASAGLAAAFNTPLGGLVYAIEELSGQHFNKFKSSLITSILIAGFSAQLIVGPYLFLGYPALTGLKLKYIPLIAFCGAIAGLCGALFSKLLHQLLVLKTKYFHSFISLSIIALFCGLLTALIGIYLNQYFLGSGKSLLMDLLFSNKQMDWYVPILRFFGPLLSSFAGVSGGIFAPSLAAGGSIGELFSSFYPKLDANLFVVVGMIGFLTGVTKAPFTAFILALEMTDRHVAVFAMMLSALVANTFSNFISKKSFYEEMKEIYLKTDFKYEK